MSERGETSCGGIFRYYDLPAEKSQEDAPEDVVAKVLRHHRDFMLGTAVDDAEEAECEAVYQANLAALQQLTEEAARLRPIHDFCVANTCTVLSPPSTNEERCGAISLDGVTCQLVEGHQGVHKNDARHWRNAAHPATNGEEGS